MNIICLRCDFCDGLTYNAKTKTCWNCGYTEAPLTFRSREDAREYFKEYLTRNQGDPVGPCLR